MQGDWKLGDLECDTQALSTVIDNGLESNCVYSYRGKLDSMRYGVGEVKRYLVSLDRDRREFTNDEVTQFNHLLAGDTTGIPRVRCYKSKNETRNRKQFSMLRAFLSGFSVVEVEDGTKEDCTNWLGDDGNISASDDQPRYLKVTCFCKFFWRSGRICPCSIIFATNQRLFFRKLTPTDLLSTLQCGKPRRGCPRQLQSQRSPWFRRKAQGIPKKSPASSGEYGEKRTFLERRSWCALNYVVVDVVEEDTKLIYYPGTIIKVPPKPIQSNRYGSSHNKKSQGPKKWVIQFKDPRRPDAEWEIDLVIQGLFNADHNGCSGLYRDEEELRFGSANLFEEASLAQHKKRYAYNVGNLLDVVKQTEPLTYVGFLVAWLKLNASGRIFVEVGRVIGFVREKRTEMMTCSKWVVKVSDPESNDMYRYLKTSDFAECLTVYDYVSYLHKAKQSAQSGKQIHEIYIYIYMCVCDAGLAP